MTLKGLLTDSRCVSEQKDFLAGSQFQPLIPECATMLSESEVEKLFFCSGRVYYDLIEKREDSGKEKVVS